MITFPVNEEITEVLSCLRLFPYFPNSGVCTLNLSTCNYSYITNVQAMEMIESYMSTIRYACKTFERFIICLKSS